MNAGTDRRDRRSALRKAGGNPGRLGRAAGILLLVVGGGAGTDRAADHPTLVSVERTDCTICHDDLTGNRATIHAPVAEDCTACHEFSISDEGTRVALTDSEPALCVACHGDLESAVQADFETPHYPVTESCLTCHDPHASDTPHLLASNQPEVCSSCHEPEDLGESHGGQITPTTRCSICHQPHGSNNARMLRASRQHTPFADGSCSGCHRAPFGERIRMRSRGERLCEACHGDVAGDQTGSVHAPLRGKRGRAGCLDCHDPHMSDETSLLLKKPLELCGDCHESIVTSALAETGHYPAGEDCLNCHLPHASGQPGLLNSPKEELCSNCHDVEDADLALAHLDADPTSLNCNDCHTPHGSGHESLLAVNLHAPVLDGCDTCHEGSFDRLMEDGESTLCLVCHETIGELAQQAKAPHAALAVGRCTDCHNPHASAQAGLVRLPAGGACIACHADQGPGDDEVLHGAIEVYGCEACHEPHGGSRPRMLRASGDQLCLSCHDPRALEIPEDGSDVVLPGGFRLPAERVREVASLRLSADGLTGHPLDNHRVSGLPTTAELRNVDTLFEGEFFCLTCHDPHKGRTEQILRWNAASPMEACMQCHPK